MAEIGHVHNTNNTSRSSSSGSYVDVSTTDCRLSGLDASSDYLFVMRAIIGGSNTGANDFEFQVNNDDAGFTDEAAGTGFSHARHNPQRNGVTNGVSYFYLERFSTDGTPDNLDFQYKGNGTDSAQCEVSEMLALKLDDITENTDFFWDEDLTSHTTLDNSGWTDGASVTIGDGTSDYAIYYFVHDLDVLSTNDDIRVRIDVGGTPNNYVQVAHRSTTGEGCIGGCVCLSAPSASTVVKIQMQTDTATAGQIDVDCNRIFALRLNKFEDHFIDITTADTNITAVDTDTVCGTAGHTTSTAATEDWAVHAFAIVDTNITAHSIEHRIEDSVLGLIAGNGTTGHETARNTMRHALPILGEEASVANSTTFDIDYIAREEFDISTQPIVSDVWAFGFTYELAAVSSTNETVYPFTGPWR